MRRRSPSAESVRIFRDAESVEEAVEQPAATVAGSAMRGTILHKLMEEVLNGETDDSVDTLAARALELMAQLAISPSDQPNDGISPDELARTVVGTLSIPEIAGLRPRLIPEYTINGGRMDADREIIVSGIADAIAYDNEGRVETVVDWKSDVAIDAERLNSYYGQLDVYRRQTSARNALLVLMTTGKIVTF
jgi:PD-(D/E)XK nuclease superfamily